MHVFWARVLQERPRLCDDRCKSSSRWMGGGIAKLRVGFGSSGLFAQDGPWWGSAIRVPHLWQPIGELLRTKPWMDSMDCYCGLGYPWPWFNLIRIRFALTAKSSKYENLFEFVVLSSSAVLCTAWEFRGSEAQSSWKYVFCIGNGVPLMFEPLHAVQTTWWSILAAHSPEWQNYHSKRRIKGGMNEKWWKAQKGSKRFWIVNSWALLQHESVRSGNSTNLKSWQFGTEGFLEILELVQVSLDSQSTLTCIWRRCLHPLHTSKWCILACNPCDSVSLFQDSDMVRALRSCEILSSLYPFNVSTCASGWTMQALGFLVKLMKQNFDTRNQVQ